MTQQVTVAQARKRRRPPLTQEELAERSDVDQTYVSLIERGLRKPSDSIRARLAKALGIAPSRLQFSEPVPAAKVTGTSDRVGHSVSGASQ